ncbi:MAG: hypothetical protein KIS91_03800 [Anaerolineae bacterium]|jgi:hypothetical protein|nr:hypothetical protein [Anaerolineae bacterium]
MLHLFLPPLGETGAHCGGEAVNGMRQGESISTTQNGQRRRIVIGREESYEDCSQIQAERWLLLVETRPWCYNSRLSFHIKE